MTRLVRRTVGLVNRAAAAVLMALIRTYQAVISPWVTQQCKYYPSCSAYGLEAVRVHGAVRGTRLTVWRVLRCNPWSDGGVDHVPPGRAAPDASIQSSSTQSSSTQSSTTQPTTTPAPAPSDLART